MKLKCRNTNEYYINSKRPFLQNPIEAGVISLCFNFTYNMVFGEGHHRNHRSG